MAYVIDNSDATLVVVDAEYADARGVGAGPDPEGPGVRGLLRHRRAQGRCRPASPRGTTSLAQGRDEEPSAPDASAVGAQMLYTSGTTGKPKGALRTGTNAQIVFALLGELGFQMGNEVHITTGPMYHSGPLAFVSLNHSAGSPIIVLRRFDPAAWLNAVKLHKVTNTFSAPTQLKRIVSLPDAELAKADCSSMRCLIANAAPVPYALKQEVIEKLGDGFLFEVYGSTEMGIITVLRPEDQLRKPGSCGKPYGGIEFRIVKDDGTVAAPGEQGELFMSTGLAMDGYHRTDEQLTEYEGGKWKSVGDIAYADDEGYLYICDRKKDMIISGGVNIYPAEIEAVLHGHPQVLDVAVFGIPDDEWGESVYCIVQAKAGEDIDLDDLARVRRGEHGQVQGAARLAGARRAPAHRRRQAAEARPARRVLARPRRLTPPPGVHGP